MKLSAGFLVVFGLIFSFSTQSEAEGRSSETLDGRRGQFRLLSADTNEEGDYHFRTSFEYFQKDDLLDDNTKVEATRATLGFGYAITPNIHVSASGGADITDKEENNFTQTFIVPRFSAAATGTYDVGRFVGLPENRWFAGASLWVDFSRISRFFKGVNVIPTLMTTGNWSEQEIPVRAHFNLSFIPKNDGRYFDSDEAPNDPNDIGVTDADRLATRTINSFAIAPAIGVELPFEDINPSVEAHLQYVKDAGFSRSPKWVTVGVKGRPFPQKNIEIFGGVDLGLSTYKNTTQARPNEKPDVYAVPLWNAVLGFGISQFGKRAGEVGVDEREYLRTRAALNDSNETLAKLKSELQYNTIRGKVIDAETNRPIPGVEIDFPDQSGLKSSSTDRNGEFVRYFSEFRGRIQFSKDGYNPSSKFLNMKPGESVTTNVELEKGTGGNFGDLAITVSDESGQGVAAAVRVINLRTNESSTGQTDSSGKLNLKLEEGAYRIEIRASGYRGQRDRFEIEAGKAVLRTYTVTNN